MQFLQEKENVGPKEEKERKFPSSRSLDADAVLEPLREMQIEKERGEKEERAKEREEERLERSRSPINKERCSGASEVSDTSVYR